MRTVQSRIDQRAALLSLSLRRREPDGRGQNTHLHGHWLTLVHALLLAKLRMMNARMSIDLMSLLLGQHLLMLISPSH